MTDPARRQFLATAGGLGLLALAGCSRGGDADPAPSRTTASSGGSSSAAPTIDPAVGDTVVDGLNVPWGIVFLPGGDALVSQRDEGTIVRIPKDGEPRTLGQVAEARGGAGGEAGLLGLALDPDDPSRLFAYVTTEEDNRVVSLDLSGGKLSRPTPVLTGIPLGGRHHGGRMVFGADKALYVATGEAGDTRLAQDRDSLGGKVLRIDRRGRAVSGNPFGNRVWSYGHRNIEGLAFDESGRLWASEFGDKKADELNLIRRGRNYGWPQAEGDEGGDGLTRPVVTWGTDDCSPGGLAITRSTAFVPALQGECLWVVPLDGRTAGMPRAIARGKHGRMRTVVVTPDGDLWVTTSNTDGRGEPKKGDDRILRVTL